MTHRDEILNRLHEEDDKLERQIEGLWHEAEHHASGIRMYRHQRVDQLRARQGAIRAKMRRIEAHPDHTWGTVQHEAEKLVEELRGVAIVAAQTFH